jgi:hypothetical protein
VRGIHRLPARFAIGPSGSTLRIALWSDRTLDDSVAHLLDDANFNWLRTDWNSSLVPSTFRGPPKRRRSARSDRRVPAMRRFALSF